MSTAWLFPGQGSQHVGMGVGWLESSVAARETIEEASEHLGFDLAALMRHGPAEDLDDTSRAQPAILAASVAIYRAALSDGHGVAEEPPPAFVAGHSMGEYSALVAAKSLTFPDALHLVSRRGELMRLAGEMRPGRMAAVLGMTDSQVEQACETIDGVEIANYNAPGQVVISGTDEAVTAAQAALAVAGAKRVVPLAVSIAAHSELMAPVAGEFAREVQATSLMSPAIPVVMNRSAAPTTDPDEIRAALARQLTEPVRWTESVLNMHAAGVTRFLEVGPGQVLSGLVRRICRGETSEVAIISLAEPAAASPTERPAESNKDS